MREGSAKRSTLVLALNAVQSIFTALGEIAVAITYPLNQSDAVSCAGKLCRGALGSVALLHWARDASCHFLQWILETGCTGILAAN